MSKRTDLAKPAPSPVLRQVVGWIIAGHSEPDIVEALAAQHPQREGATPDRRRAQRDRRRRRARRPACPRLCHRRDQDHLPQMP